MVEGRPWVSHACEIAQSEAKTGQDLRQLLDARFINVDNEKMSKSLKASFVTVHDMLKTIDGQVLRFFLATQQSVAN